MSTRRLIAALTFVALGACDGEGDGDDQAHSDDPDTTPGDTDTPGSDTDDTDATPGTGDPALGMACTGTPNALRFLCTVTVTPAQAVELTFARADGLSAVRTVSSDASQVSHDLPLYFLAPGQVYDVTASAVGSPELTATTTVTAGQPPPNMNTSLTMTGTSTMGMIGTHLPCNGTATAVVYDTTTGDLVWYQNMDPGGTFGANDMVVFTEDHTVLGESEGDVVEVDLMGTDLVRLENLDAAFGVTAGGLFGNFHHDIAKRNGTYYVFYQEEYGGGFDVLDNVIVFDGSGTELARWVALDHLVLPPNWGGDFLHTNAVYVDPAGDIYLSWLTQESIGKIEGDTTSPDFGTVLWMLSGDGGGSFSTITTNWGAVGGADSFSDQHGANVRPDGRLQLLDNDGGRGLVVSIDEVASTATVDAAYDTRESTCGPQGTSTSTQGGNAVVGCSGDWIREYDGIAGTLLWEAQVQCSGGGGFVSASRWYPLDGW